jgi:YD repeat-containing protein
MKTLIRIAVTLSLLQPSAALPQQQRETFKDANGRVTGWATTNNVGTQFYDSSARNVGRSVTGSNGSTTSYDASGRVTGRSTISNGTTTLYDASGRRVGSIKQMGR